MACYMQVLYFCIPFREQLLDYYENNKIVGDAEENLLTCLADLFSQVCGFLRIAHFIILIILPTLFHQYVEILFHFMTLLNCIFHYSPGRKKEK